MKQKLSVDSIPITNGSSAEILVALEPSPPESHGGVTDAIEAEAALDKAAVRQAYLAARGSP